MYSYNIGKIDLAHNLINTFYLNIIRIDSTEFSMIVLVVPLQKYHIMEKNIIWRLSEK